MAARVDDILNSGKSAPYDQQGTSRCVPRGSQGRGVCVFFIIYSSPSHFSLPSVFLAFSGKH